MHGHYRECGHSSGVAIKRGSAVVILYMGSKTTCRGFIPRMVVKRELILWSQKLYYIEQILHKISRTSKHPFLHEVFRECMSYYIVHVMHQDTTIAIAT